MEIRESVGRYLAPTDAIWAGTGPTRPWNDPVQDLPRAPDGTTTAVSGFKRGDLSIGTLMGGSVAIEVDSLIVGLPAPTRATVLVPP